MVGPMRKTTSASIAAIDMLMFDSHLRPLWTPDSTDHSAIAVTTAMMPMMSPDELSAQPRNSRPATIWLTPNPKEVATPNSVPMIAIESIVWPIHPSTRLRPMSGSSSHRTASGRPRRKVM